MKFIVSSGALKKALKPLRFSYNSSTVLPVLEDVLVIVDANKKIATFSTTDLENWTSVDVSVETDESFHFHVHFPYILDLVNQIDDQPLTFILKLPKVDSDYPVLRMETIAAEETFALELALSYKKSDGIGNYPKWPSFQSPDLSFEWEHKKINPILQNSLGFISNDDLRPAMTGLCMCAAHSEKLHFVATDAHKLYYQKMEDGFPSRNEFESIIPIRGIRALIELTKPADGHLSFHIHKVRALDSNIMVRDGHIVAKTGNYTFITRIIDAKFPDWRVILPQPSGKFFFKRKQLATFLKLAVRFSNKATRQIALSIENGKAKINGGDLDFSNRFDYTIPVYNIDGENLMCQVAFNSSFFQMALRTSNDEYVKVEHVNSSTKAVLIDSNIIIMPLLINQ